MLNGIMVADALSARSAGLARRAAMRAADRLEKLSAALPGLVVLGWQAPSWLERLRTAWAFGALARRSRQPVLVLRNGSGSPYRRVLVAVDLSDAGLDAALDTVRAAVRCAPGARFTLLHPLDTGVEGYMRRAAVASHLIGRHRRRLRTAARAAFRRFVARLGLPGVRFSLLVSPHPERAALHVHAASERPDLVVLAKPARGLFGAWCAHSAAREALAATDCDLLLVTPPRPR